MRNSLSLSADETQKLLESDVPYTVRLKVDDGPDVSFDDVVRGTVRFKASELDDKVLLKADGMPTYHLANVVDDHLMEISHVIRGRRVAVEHCPSCIMLYRAFGWEDSMPTVCASSR